MPTNDGRHARNHRSRVTAGSVVQSLVANKKFKIGATQYNPGDAFNPVTYSLSAYRIGVLLNTRYLRPAP